jgi:hypothetical protein
VFAIRIKNRSGKLYFTIFTVIYDPKYSSKFRLTEIHLRMGCHELAEHILLLLLLVGGQSQRFLALIEPAGKVEERRYFIEDRFFF